MKLQCSEEKKDLKALDEMIAEIIVDAYGDHEQLWAFRQVFEDSIELPADGFVIGEPVSVLEIDYDGNERRGLTARCRREDGSKYVVAVSEVVFSQGSAGAPGTSQPIAGGSISIPSLPGYSLLPVARGNPRQTTHFILTKRAMADLGMKGKSHYSSND